MSDLAITQCAKTLTAALTGMGVSASYTSQLVNGSRTPSLRLALEIQDKLGIPPGHWASRKNMAAPSEAA